MEFAAGSVASSHQIYCELLDCHQLSLIEDNLLLSLTVDQACNASSAGRLDLLKLSLSLMPPVCQVQVALQQEFRHFATSEERLNPHLTCMYPLLQVHALKLFSIKVINLGKF